MCAANGYSYYVCTRETIGYMGGEVGGPVEIRMRSYMLMFNGYEMDHLALLRSVPRKTSHGVTRLLLPLSARRLYSSGPAPLPSPGGGVVLTSRSEQDDEESGSSIDTMEDAVFILDTEPQKDYISIRRGPFVVK